MRWQRCQFDDDAFMKGQTMTALTLSRTQRLRTLENHIRKSAEQIQKNGLEIGRDLCEIRDDELWADGYDSWNQYLKDRAGELVGKSFAQAARLIEASEMEKKIPNHFAGKMEAEHAIELRRLAPDIKQESGGKKKDVSRLKKTDVARVLKSAAQIAKDVKGDESKISKRDIRKAVDKELGIDRKAQAAERAEKQEEITKPMVDVYLRKIEGTLKGALKNLSDVPGESWELLEKNYPGLIARVVKACDDLAEFLRS